MSALLPPIVHLAAKNRFSRGFVLAQKGGGCKCGQNEFLFKKAILCTCLGAICSKMECVLPLNALRFGAQCLAFWCKMECVLVLNARWNGAKCETKSIKNHCKWYKQNLLELWNSWPKGAKQPSKSGVLGVKSGYLGLQKYELATKLERQNGAKRKFSS